MACGWSIWNWLGRMRLSCIRAPSTADASFPVEVADFQRSVILNQVENGIAVRMAVLEKVIG